MLMASKAEEDTKIKKNNRPREVLFIIYPIYILKQIYNCIDWDKKKYKDLSHFRSSLSIGNQIFIFIERS